MQGRFISESAARGFTGGYPPPMAGTDEHSAYYGGASSRCRSEISQLNGPRRFFGEAGNPRRKVAIGPISRAAPSQPAGGLRDCQMAGARASRKHGIAPNSGCSAARERILCIATVSDIWPSAAVGMSLHVRAPQTKEPTLAIPRTHLAYAGRSSHPERQVFAKRDI